MEIMKEGSSGMLFFLSNFGFPLMPLELLSKGGSVGAGPNGLETLVGLNELFVAQWHQRSKLIDLV